MTVILLQSNVRWKQNTQLNYSIRKNNNGKTPAALSYDTWSIFIVLFICYFLGSSRQLVYIVRASCLYSLEFHFFPSTIWRGILEWCEPILSIRSFCIQQASSFIRYICSVAIKTFPSLDYNWYLYHIAIHYNSCNEAFNFFNFLFPFCFSPPMLCMIFMMTSTATISSIEMSIIIWTQQSCRKCQVEQSTFDSKWILIDDTNFL